MVSKTGEFERRLNILEKNFDDLPALSQLLNGLTLRNKLVSRAGKTSAVVFIPKFFLGQRVKVVIVPENTEVSGLRDTIEVRNTKIRKLNKKIFELNSGEPEIEEIKNLEEEDEY